MLNQTLYIMKVLLKEEMKNCLHVEILMKSKLFIILNEMNDVIKANLINMQQIVKKLMYIACNTQLNIVFTVECLS